MRITPSRPSHLWFWLFPRKTLHRFASLGLKSRIDAHLWAFPGKTLHRFASLGLKSRIAAHLWAFPGKTLHRFPSLALKSRITARRRANLGQSLQRFPSLTPEIKNHCSPGVVAVCRRNHSSLRQRKLESNAGNHCRHGRSRRNHSSMQRRRLESDAEDRCSHGSCRRNNSSLLRQKLVSDAEHRAATAVAGGTIFFRGNGEQEVSEKSYEESPIEDMGRAGLRFF